MRQNDMIPCPVRVCSHGKISRVFISLIFGAILLFPTAGGGFLWGNVRLSTIFSSHMVLQRERPIRIRGEAAPGEKVKVTLTRENANQDQTNQDKTNQGQTEQNQTEQSQTGEDGSASPYPAREVTAETDRNGVWSVTLPPLSTGGPYQLIAEGKKNSQQIQDIWVGDVWLFVGSRAMLRGSSTRKGSTPEDSTLEEEAKPPVVGTGNIRILSLAPQESSRRKSAIRGQWNLWDKEKKTGELALAAAFAREIDSRLSIPVGIVVTARDPAGIEQWSVPEMAIPADTGENENLGTLFYGTLAPLTRLAIRGVVFEPDDLDIPRASQYGKTLMTMIQQWRMEWKQGDFPFYCVETGALIGPDEENTESAAAEYREAQRRAHALRRVGSVVTFDQGVPAAPEKIGQRLAELALRDEYRDELTLLANADTDTDTNEETDEETNEETGENTGIDIPPIYSDPVPRAITFINDKAVIRFSGDIHLAVAGHLANAGQEVDDGNRKDNGNLKDSSSQSNNSSQSTDDDQTTDTPTIEAVPPVTGFVLAGQDRKFYKAQGVIEGDSVIVTSDFVASPVAVRYCWSDAPKGNLLGNGDLPVPGFRSDCWRGITDAAELPQ